jgi:hypothetical protein
MFEILLVLELVEILLITEALLLSEPAETLLLLEVTESVVDVDGEATEIGDESGEEPRSKSTPKPMVVLLLLSNDVFVASKETCACGAVCDCS